MTEVHIPARALVLVGDGQRALFLRNRGTPRQVELIVERELAQADSRKQQIRGGRAKGEAESDRPSYSAIEKTIHRRQSESRFAADIAATLHVMEHAHQFEELVVVAPPEMLGDLRAAFHPEVEARLVAEVAKDLVSRPVPEIAKLLA